MTSVFFNGAQWNLPWLNRIFPGTHKHPDKHDVVVNDFFEFWALVLACETGLPSEVVQVFQQIAGPLQQCLAFFRLLFVPVPVHHAHARIAFEICPVPVNEVPVK